MDIEEIFMDIETILSQNPELEGVTLLGGEPFNQAESLALLAKKIKKLGLSIVTFSGYTYEKLLHTNHKHWNALLSQTDLLIDGPYVESLQDLSRPWVGSKNQKYRFLTDVYQDQEATLLAIDNKLEICIHPDGTITLNGMMTSLDLEELMELGFTKEEAKNEH